MTTGAILSDDYSFDPIYISHLRALTRISDPVHGTISLTCFDREVVDSAYFQRLHFVLQNSTTYAAYPANKNTRFIHSIGVAELCGQMFVTALNSASSTCLNSFMTDFANFFETQFVNPRELGGDANDYRKKVLEGWEQTVKGRAGFSHSPYIRGIAQSGKGPISGTDCLGPTDQIPAMFVVDTLWQALRVCGLAHDIGHLPMSHSFEMALASCPLLFEIYEDVDPDGMFNQRELAVKFSDALKHSEYASLELGDAPETTGEPAYDAEYLKNASKQIRNIAKIYGHEEDVVRKFLSFLPVHERRSLYILAALAEANRFNLHKDSPAFRYRATIYWIAFFILYSSLLDRHGAKSGVDGSDVGSEYSFFRVLKSIVASELDADRLDYTVRDGFACGSSIGNFDIPKLISDAVLIQVEGNYYVGMHQQAIQEIERFFSQRRETYKYLIYHKTSSRSEACLRELIARVLHYSFTFRQSKVAELLKEYRYLSADKNEYIVKVLPLDDFSLQSQDDTSLRSVLFQIWRHLESIDPDMPEGNERICGPIKWLCNVVLLREFKDISSPYKNSSLPRRLTAKFPEQISAEGLKDLVKTLSQGTLWEEYEKRFRTRMAEQNPGIITIVNLKFPKTFKKKPKWPADQIYVVDDDAKYHEIAQKSSTLRQLADADYAKLDIDVYFVSEDIRKNPNKTSELRESAEEILRDLYLEVSNLNS